MARSRPRPFVDTDVLFSGLHSERGHPAAILRDHAGTKLVIVISRQVLDELVSTIRAKKPDLLSLLYTF